MAVTLPISVAVRPGNKVAAPARAIPTAPAVGLSLAFTLTGLMALFVAMGWLLVEPALLTTYHYNQEVIAVTHLVVLGWICSIVMGAVYQLVPVALETQLYSEKLAAWQLAFHVVGFIGMVAMFRVWNVRQVSHFGLILGAGVILFVYNIVETLRRAPKWTVTATAISTVLAWISLTVLAGLSLAAAKSVDGSLSAAGVQLAPLPGLRALASLAQGFDPMSAMHAHAHLGGVGCFTILIVGVSYKLIPMFTLSEVQSRARAGWSVALLNVGLIGSFVAILLRSPGKPLFALVVLGALALYGCELAAILGARKRRALDWGVKSFLSALAWLGPVAILAGLLSWPSLPLTALTGQLENAYGFLALVGVVTFAIIGMLYKIVPFLVWFGRYSSQVGRAQVPALADLYSARLQAAGYWSYMSGLLVTSVAIVLADAQWVRAGLTLLALSLATLAWNIGLMLSHFLNPKLKPLQPFTASAPHSA